MNVASKVFKKFTLSNFIKLSFFINLIYVVLKIVLSKSGLVYRQGLIDLIYINNIILVFLIAISLKGSLNQKNKPVKGTILSLIVILIGLWNIFFMYAFSQKSEMKIYKEGKLVVASCDSLFLDTLVTYYEPVNMFLMKESNIEAIRYNGAYNCYKYNEMNSEFLEDEYVELTNSIQLLEMTPIDAKKKFSKDTFEYLGNYTYDFGDIIIKFNERESGVEGILFKTDVVKTDGESIIGKDINSVQAKIRNVSEKEYTNEYDKCKFEWIVDEDGKRSVKVIDKFENGVFLLGFDNNDKVDFIKFSSNVKI